MVASRARKRNCAWLRLVRPLTSFFQQVAMWLQISFTFIHILIPIMRTNVTSLALLLQMSYNLWVGCEAATSLFETAPSIVTAIGIIAAAVPKVSMGEIAITMMMSWSGIGARQCMIAMLHSLKKFYESLWSLLSLSVIYWCSFNEPHRRGI